MEGSNTEKSSHDKKQRSRGVYPYEFWSELNKVEHRVRRQPSFRSDSTPGQTERFSRVHFTEDFLSQAGDYTRAQLDGIGITLIGCRRHGYSNVIRHYLDSSNKHLSPNKKGPELYEHTFTLKE